MNDHGQVMAGEATRRHEERSKLIGFVEQIAHGWADQLEVNKNAVEWVAVKSGTRTRIDSADPHAFIHPLDNDAGIAFVLGSSGVMDLLFVVRHKRGGYSVSFSDNTHQVDQGERHDVRPGYGGDLKYLLMAAKRYVRRINANH